MAYAVRRPVENVYLVRERDRKRTREFAALALTAVPPMLVLLAAIWANLETVRLGYQIARVAKQKESLLERNRQLRMDRAQATSLARVDALARTNLGLIPPAPWQILRIEEGEPGAAPAAPRSRPAAPAAPTKLATAPATTEEGF
jgi:cell division protein FtsL